MQMTPTSHSVLTLLNAHQSDAVLANMAPRYGIHTTSAIGVSMADMKDIARQVGMDHDLALELWATGIYEARTVAALIDVPASVTAKQMDAWCRDFDNWAICDTVCFNLFDRSKPAWTMVDRWAARTKKFEKRAAFALLWSLALHDKVADDERFVHGLELIEREAVDDRNFVTKAIAMALRAVGRRNPVLTAAAIDTAGRMLDAPDPSARRIGRTALREMAATA